MRNHPTRVIERLIRTFKIPVTLSSILAESRKYPDFPNFNSMVKMLSHLGISSEIIHGDVAQLQTVRLPCLVSLSGNVLMVSGLSETHVVISDHRSNSDPISLNDFQQLFSGIILSIDPGNSFGERDFKHKRRIELLQKCNTIFLQMIAIFLPFFFIVTFFFRALDVSILLWGSVKILGLILTIFLLRYLIARNNSFVQKICENKGCEDILSSKAAHAFWGITWSEVGFFYFSATLLIMWCEGATSEVLSFLVILNILSLPYTLYSIYHQWRIAKRWCSFCVTIQILLWAELFIGNAYLSDIQNLRPLDLLKFLFYASLPATIWIAAKSYLIEFFELREMKALYYTMKYDAPTFTKLLTVETRHDLLDQATAISIGNESGKNVITVVSNPLCEPCAAAHQSLESLLRNRPDIRIQVVFLCPKNPEDERSVVARQLLSLYCQDSDRAQQALTDWYSIRSFEKWSKMYPLIESPDASENLRRHQHWCNEIGVRYTPTILINGYKLPANYYPGDIGYVI